MSEAGEVFAVGSAHRRVGNNGVNAQSSRAHAVFQIKVGASTLNLVDLAGSEKHPSALSAMGRNLPGLKMTHHGTTLPDFIKLKITLPFPPIYQEGVNIRQNNKKIPLPWTGAVQFDQKYTDFFSWRDSDLLKSTSGMK